MLKCPVNMDPWNDNLFAIGYLLDSVITNMFQSQSKTTIIGKKTVINHFLNLCPVDVTNRLYREIETQVVDGKLYGTALNINSKWLRVNEP